MRSYDLEMQYNRIEEEIEKMETEIGCLEGCSVLSGVHQQRLRRLKSERKAAINYVYYLQTGHAL